MGNTVPINSLTKVRKEPTTAQSVYDAHHPPATELIDQCVHCGFCLPTCPTYMLWNEEMDSPRGRIYLMKMGAEGGVAKMDEQFVSHFDRCLGCMACVTACPSGVQYDKLIETTRAQIERNFRRPLWDRVFRWMIFSLFPHPKRLRLMALPMWIYQRSGLRWLLRKSGLLRLLPRQLQSMEALLPEIHLRKVFAPMPRVRTQARPRMRVGVLLGCVQRVFFSDVNAATIRVLASVGCDVVVPQGQECCGALMAHAGRENDALDAARRLIDVFERANVEVIAINSAGCGSNMKEYGYLLRDDPEYAERAKALAAKCRDVSEIVAELGIEKPTNAMRMKIAYHDSCHLQHAQQIRMQPRKLLNAVPGLEIAEIADSAICCGSAGIYNLIKPEAANALADRKAQNIISTGAQALVSANPGCLLHIASALKRAGHPLPVMHLVEVLDQALGLAPERQAHFAKAPVLVAAQPKREPQIPSA